MNGLLINEVFGWFINDKIGCFINILIGWLINDIDYPQAVNKVGVHPVRVKETVAEKECMY